MARSQRTDEYLAANSEWLLQGILMFGHTGRLIERETRKPDEMTLDERVGFSALMDSKLVHARQLMRFLYVNDGAWGTDICAVDYLPDVAAQLPAWDSVNRKYELREPDKEIGHLSYHRLVSHDYTAMIRQLHEILLAFIEVVPEGRVLPDFKSRALAALGSPEAPGVEN